MTGSVAAEPRAGGTVVIGENERVGNIEAFAGDVVVRGVVDGNLLALSGNVRITGEVTGNVESAAGSILVSGRIGGDLDAGAGSVIVDETGVVAGDVEVGAGTVVVAGTVEGSARIGADRLTLRQTARIGGDLTFDGQLDRADGASVDGTVTRDPNLETGGFFAAGPIPHISAFFVSIYFFLVNLVVGALLLLVFPRFTDRLAVSAQEQPGTTALAGIGALVGTPIALVLIALTIVGIPITIFGALAYGLGIWLAIILGRYVVGVWLLSLVDVQNRWLALVTGLVAMAILTRVPYVGDVLDLLVLVVGLGALALGLLRGYRRRRGRSEPPTEATDGPEETEPSPA